MKRSIGRKAPIVLLIVGAIGAVLIAAATTWHLRNQRHIDHTESKFIGTITADECATTRFPIGDVGCWVRVDNATIQVKHGNANINTPWGSLENVSDIKENLDGKTAEVYASEIGKNNYTLAGSTTYYVKLLN